MSRCFNKERVMNLSIKRSCLDLTRQPLRYIYIVHNQGKIIKRFLTSYEANKFVRKVQQEVLKEQYNANI